MNDSLTTAHPVEETADGLAIEGIAIPFGSRDFEGERFSPSTDLALDWFPGEGRPLLFHHGRDKLIDTEVIGRQVERRITDAGVWIRAWLDRRAKWFELVKALLDRDALGFSSGAMGHLVQTTKSGDILKWPWVEISLTPTPASTATPVYRVKAADAIAHLMAAGNVLPAADVQAELQAIAGRAGAITAQRQAEWQAIVSRTESPSVDVQAELRAIARNAARTA